VSNDNVEKLSGRLLRKSRGPKIASGYRVLAYYQGTLLNGEEFDANFNFSSFEAVRNRDPFSFTLGAGEVIEGLDKGLRGRRIGSVVELTIPAEMAYGESGAGDAIPPNSPLKFTVEILAANDSPNGGTTQVFANWRHFGINTKKIGLTTTLIQSTTSFKLGLDAGDELLGTSYNDLLVGLRGKDRLTGNRGADVLIGGPGKDIFVYTNVNDSPSSKRKSDHLLAFGRKDKIDLSEVADELRFIGNDPFSGMAGDVRFDNETLELDKNGDGTADLALLMPGTQSIDIENLIL